MSEKTFPNEVSATARQIAVWSFSFEGYCRVSTLSLMSPSDGPDLKAPSRVINEVVPFYGRDKAVI